MTKEEKAKAYDEALKRAKKILCNINEYSDSCRDIETIFPQLAESEDEKIIRTIIDALYSHTNSINLLSSRGYQMENIEAWLEKQKEQKHADEDRYMEGYINEKNDALKEQKSIKWDELTWEDINDLESIMNEVHSDFRAGISEKNFGIEVLERFRYNKGDEYLDAIEPKFKVGDEICSVDGQYKDTVLEVLSDGSYRLKNLGILSIPESEWRLVNAPVDGYELIDKQQSIEQKPVEWSETFEENIRILLHDKLTWHSEDGSMSTTVLIDDKTLKDIINGIWFYVGKEALKYPNKELKTARVDR